MEQTFLSEFQERGYFHQCTHKDELNLILNKKKIRAYIGFDCTASSLHVGSLLQIMCLRMLQKFGHQPVVLLGGGTTQIGDPSGKDETRKILSEKEIKKNSKNIEKILKKFLITDNKKIRPIFVNNKTWLNNLKYIKFLREIGKYFTINKMLSFDSVKLRLEREQSLSYMEFNYMILQAYDFLELNKKKKCILQIGGSDQWGNIVNGVDLIKRYLGKESFGLTTPLITSASGLKMGKTEKGAIWLDKKLLKPYDYWQFWRNTDDKDVFKFLKMFTDIDINQLDKMKNFNINKLKICLANETTALLHGKKEAKKAESSAKKIFENREISENLPVYKIKLNDLMIGINIVDITANSKLLNSKSEVRRAINNKGIKINDEIIQSDKFILSEKNFKNNLCKLSFGKKRHIVLKVN